MGKAAGASADDESASQEAALLEQKNGNDEDGDGKSVPESRLKAALANQRANYESQLGNLRAEFEAFKAGSQKQDPADRQQQPKRYTRRSSHGSRSVGLTGPSTRSS